MSHRRWLSLMKYPNLQKKTVLLGKGWSEMYKYGMIIILIFLFFDVNNISSLAYSDLTAKVDHSKIYLFLILFILIILFYFILFYFILFYFILFYFILFYFIYFILFYFILFYFIFYILCYVNRIYVFIFIFVSFFINIGHFYHLLTYSIHIWCLV